MGTYRTVIYFELKLASDEKMLCVHCVASSAWEKLTLLF